MIFFYIKIQFIFELPMKEVKNIWAWLGTNAMNAQQIQLL